MAVIQTKPPGMPEADWQAYQNSMNSGEGTPNPNPDEDKPTGVESNIDTTKYDSNNNKTYYDATKSSREEYSPNSENKSKTGSGAVAAVGTQYSWNTKASGMAENAYQQKVLEEKQGLLTQRQELEKNAQQYQTQADMQQYSDNQAADKVGWTGGYVLDKERQREYMKQSIQAQLYGAMELQKYGYDTSMAAARLAYDAGMMQYAEEYYNQAVQTSINEAQITGVYFSAEVKDMLGQMKAAESKLADSTISDEDRKRAENIKKTIENWFSVNDISTKGIKTLERYSSEQSLELQWQNELWNQYQAARDASKTDLSYNKVYQVDKNGNIMYDGNEVKIMDLNSMSSKDQLEYALSGNKANEQIQGYFEGLIREKVNNYKQSVYDETTKTFNTKEGALTEVINKAAEEILNKFNSLSDADKETYKDTLKTLKDNIESFKTTIFKETYPTKELSDKSINSKVAQEPSADEAKADAIAAGWLGEKDVWEYANAGADISAFKKTGYKEATSTYDKPLQDAWISILSQLSKDGEIPNGTKVNLNVRKSSTTDGTHIYIDGKWIHTRKTGVALNEKEPGVYQLMGSNTNWEGLIKNLNDITGEDYSDYVKKYKETNNIK